MFQYIVLFKFKDQKELPIVKEKLLLLASQAPEIMKMEVGIDIINAEQSYQMSLYIAFDSLEDFKRRNENPAHAKVRDYIHDVMSDSAAVGYNIE